MPEEWKYPRMRYFPRIVRHSKDRSMLDRRSERRERQNFGDATTVESNKRCGKIFRGERGRREKEGERQGNGKVDEWNFVTATRVLICWAGAQIQMSRIYRARNKGMHILLSNSQAGSGRTTKQEQEEISRNHVQAFIPGSVQTGAVTCSEGFVICFLKFPLACLLVRAAWKLQHSQAAYQTFRR